MARAPRQRCSASCPHAQSSNAGVTHLERLGRDDGLCSKRQRRDAERCIATPDSQTRRWLSMSRSCLSRGTFSCAMRVSLCVHMLARLLRCRRRSWCATWTIVIGLVASGRPRSARTHALISQRGRVYDWAKAQLGYAVSLQGDTAHDKLCRQCVAPVLTWGWVVGWRRLRQS